MTVAAAVFVALAAVLCGAAVLIVLGAAHVGLSGSDAIERDGLARGRRAPRWSLTDAEGAVHTSPPARSLQLVVFADHSLKTFPSVLDGLRELCREPDLDVVLMLKRPSTIAAPLLRMLAVDLPVVTGSPAMYAAYNVRVGPFAIFVDDAGQVRSSSLVNYDWQLAKLHQLAQIPVAESDPAPRLRRGRLTGRRKLAGTAG